MKPCKGKNCGKLTDPWHHKFKQNTANLKAYGKKLIDLPWNKEYYCNDCNAGHSNVRKEDIKDEQWFREMLYATGHNDLPEPTKSLKNKMMRRK